VCLTLIESATSAIRSFRMPSVPIPRHERGTGCRPAQSCTRTNPQAIGHSSNFFRRAGYPATRFGTGAPALGPLFLHLACAISSEQMPR
jgi:hypothetical protein